MRYSVGKLMLAVSLVLTASWATHGFAQAPSGQLEIGVTRPQGPPAPPKAPDLIQRGQPEGLTGIQEQRYYPERIRSRHDPAFLSPVTGTIQTGPKPAAHAGLSLWTSPIHGGVQKETGGVLSFGFSLVWDVPQSPSGDAKAQKDETGR